MLSDLLGYPSGINAARIEASDSGWCKPARNGIFRRFAAREKCQKESVLSTPLIKAAYQIQIIRFCELAYSNHQAPGTPKACQLLDS